MQSASIHHISVSNCLSLSSEAVNAHGQVQGRGAENVLITRKAEMRRRESNK